MSVWGRLILSVVLGVAAAALNYFAVASQSKPNTFRITLAASDLPAGHKIGPADIGPVSIAGDYDKMRQVLVPWEERAILFGRPISRALKGGDALLWRDMDPPDVKFELQADEVALQIPFRDVAFDPRDSVVGQSFGLVVGSDTGSAQVLGPFRLLRRLNAGDSVMTIAARRVTESEWDKQTGDLLKSLSKGSRIQGVIFYPPGKAK